MRCCQTLFISTILDCSCRHSWISRFTQGSSGFTQTFCCSCCVGFLFIRNLHRLEICCGKVQRKTLKSLKLATMCSLFLFVFFPLTQQLWCCNRHLFPGCSNFQCFATHFFSSWGYSQGSSCHRSLERDTDGEKVFQDHKHTCQNLDEQMNSCHS